LILPIKDPKEGYKSSVPGNSITFAPLNRQSLIGHLLVGLLVPFEKFPENAAYVWDHIYRIFGMIKGFLHPNNQIPATDKVLSLILEFVKSFTRRVNRD
jgi:hypothetical protein